MHPSRRVISLDCVQLLHDTPETPLLPPDYVNSSPDLSYNGVPRTTRLHDSVRARREYNQLRKEKSSILRRRKFVFGAMYDQLFPGYYEVDAMFKDYDLMVELPSKKLTKVQVRLLSPYDGNERGCILP